MSGLSQPYIHRYFAQLTEQGLARKIGNGRATYYVGSSRTAIEGIKIFDRTFNNSALSESAVFEMIEKQTGIFRNVKKEVRSIVNYGFTEMLNNAIEHSKSERIRVRMEISENLIRFDVIDRGIGIFKNLRRKFKLNSDLEAIEELLKGKRTTSPANHTGEGIFFTSKAADVFVIKSPGKKIVFDNTISDVFISNTIVKKGTGVSFSISLDSKKKLAGIFNRFTDENYVFNKTEIRVRLYKYSTELISRSQAKRLLSGLDTFKTIILDFKNVHVIGQGFADEIFRVYQGRNKHTKIEFANADENIVFMINRAKSNIIPA
jgi:anti-sigma regulatory factor (Ser/Thr protein kinase)